jgi:eukaryotic-like serine/threonine-protein kinase
MENALKHQKDRRQCPRKLMKSPQVGIIYLQCKESPDSDFKKKPDVLFVNVLNMSKNGLLLESSQKIKDLLILDMRIWYSHKRVWMSIKGKVKWTAHCPSKPGRYFWGVRFLKKPLQNDAAIPVSGKQKKLIKPSDLEFLLRTTFFRAIPKDAICPLLNSLTFKHLKKGERLISQGDEGDSFYIILRGSCVINLEKENTLHPVARLRAGDIVGEMAVLTGERRSTHVDAETDMDLLSISRTQFDSLSSEYPELRNFLTEIITHRFSVSRQTADRTIGKYVITEIIGQGAWSMIYKGIHGKLRLPVAIKMLKHNMAMDTEFLEKFRNEAKIIARLNHTNIIKVFDIEELYRTVFIIMEYLEGTPLDDLLDRMPKLSLPVILDIILQVCYGLDYAHKQGIVHQDIKPANIFIQPDGKVKIVDFGLACPPGNIDFNLPGTVFYMSPEQIEGNPVDERTDIYALGITAYEMITGQRPFPENNIAKLMDLHLSEDGPDPSLLASDLPDELRDFLMGSIKKDPDARFKNMSQILKKLLPLAEKLDLKVHSQQRKRGKMISMFIFYDEEHQLALNQFVDKFSNDIEEIGATLRVAQFEDI